MFAGPAPELRGTKTRAEGNERLSVETRVPRGAVRGPFRDCGRRAVVCICTEASELPDPLTEEGSAAPDCTAVFVPTRALWTQSEHVD